MAEDNKTQYPYVDEEGYTHHEGGLRSICLADVKPDYGIPIYISEDTKKKGVLCLRPIAYQIMFLFGPDRRTTKEAADIISKNNPNLKFEIIDIEKVINKIQSEKVISKKIRELKTKAKEDKTTYILIGDCTKGNSEDDVYKFKGHSSLSWKTYSQAFVNRNDKGIYSYWRVDDLMCNHSKREVYIAPKAT